MNEIVTYKLDIINVLSGDLTEVPIYNGTIYSFKPMDSPSPCDRFNITITPCLNGIPGIPSENVSESSLYAGKACA